MIKMYQQILDIIIVLLMMQLFYIIMYSDF